MENISNGNGASASGPKESTVCSKLNSGSGGFFQVSTAVLATCIEGPVTEVTAAVRALENVDSCNPMGEKEKGVFEYMIEPKDEKDIRRDIFGLACEKNWPILSVRSAEMTLEEIFLKLTSGEYVAPVKEAAAEEKTEGSEE